MGKWNRDETIVAFNVYCKIPFKSSSKTNPTVVKYAKILGRTPSALNMKIGNIGRLDPNLKEQGIVGLGHGAKLEEEIWHEFYDDPERLAYESEKIIARLLNQSVEMSADVKVDDLPKGEDREVIVKQRINQSFFRSAVMSSYNFRCCISGIGNPALLEACHIVDWSNDIANRTNPRNGLCLNPLFHKAYDNFLVAITPDLTIVISDEMIDNVAEVDFKAYLCGINGRKIISPDKFRPKKEFLEIHYEQFKQK